MNIYILVDCDNEPICAFENKGHAIKEADESGCHVMTIPFHMKDKVILPVEPTICQNASCKHKTTESIGSEKWYEGLLVCKHCFKAMIGEA